MMVRWLRNFMLLLTVSILFTECRPKRGRGLWPMGVKYEIFVLAFADSNNDGKGDLNGVTERLGYLENLGVNGIWLMPIMPSPSYHKYDITDFKNIHPDYGTLDDFKRLVKEAHSRDIKVIVDLVLNHTSVQHPWFQSAASSENSSHRDYYVWNDRQSISQNKNTALAYWHTVNGDSTADYYYGYFSNQMPDLNFDNQKVREEFVDIARFWIEEMKVDGFRLDAANHLYPNDRPWDNHQFWKWFRGELEKIKPDIYLVGEVFSINTSDASRFTKGIPSLFNFQLGKSILNSLLTGRNVGLINEYQSQLESYRLVEPGFIDAPFLTNHHQNRVISELHNDIAKAKVAASILLTLPGTPYIYYGEELGMRGMKPDEYIREPFLWGDTELESHWITPNYSSPSTVKPLAEQNGDDESLYNHYKRLIYYRNTNPIFTAGDIKPIHRLPQEVIGFMRVLNNETAIVFHNVSERDVAFTLEDDLIFYKRIDFQTNAKTTFEGYVVTLPALSSIVIKKAG
jgi:alpha-amylase